MAEAFKRMATGARKDYPDIRLLIIPGVSRQAAAIKALGSKEVVRWEGTISG